MDEVSVFHVLRDALQEAERLVEHDRHRDLGQLLRHDDDDGKHNNKQKIEGKVQ